MLSVLEAENFHRILTDMSGYEKRDGFKVGCIVGESRFLDNVNYMFFEVIRDGFKASCDVANQKQVTQFIVLQFTHPPEPLPETEDGEKGAVGDPGVTQTFHPIFCNGSFLVNGAVVSDCALVLSEAFANFKDNSSREGLNKALKQLEIDVPYETDLPDILVDAFSQAAPTDTTHGLRFIDKDIKVFTDYIGL